jgi:hypothetical protein
MTVILTSESVDSMCTHPAHFELCIVYVVTQLVNWHVNCKWVSENKATNTDAKNCILISMYM